MIRRIFKQLKNESPKVGEEELQELFNEIESKEREIADKKANFKEEFSNGARLSKHRFTL